MTFQEIQKAIEKFDNNWVVVTLTENRNVTGILKNAYIPLVGDPRGYTVPYFEILIFNGGKLITEQYDCDKVISVELQ